jgi:hypothetical protein
MSLVAEFIRQVGETWRTQQATEHSYRPALKTLFDGLKPGDVTATNEPKRIACGAPDFILQTGDIAVGFVEAKDLGLDLRHMKDANKDQQKRYLAALPNLIYTNCLDWDFYRNGQLVASVTVADHLMGIQPKPDQYAALENLLRDFIAQRPQTITSPKVLAEIMAGKAGLIKDVLRNALKADADLGSELGDQFKAFREHLIHDITPEDFADIYAETIAYGMFAARLHDPTLDTFTRQEALELLPKSNPFLRNLFSYILGPNLDDGIKWIIDDLAKVFQAANVAKIMEGFGKLTGQNDPFLHFYETFLAAYNPAKRKARGVWYTPEPVVNFIVRAVDQVLKTEFGLADGLADTSKVTVDWDTGQTDNKGKPVKIKKEVHRVQILDPATGTGTFLAEVIKQIAPNVKGVAPGMWSQYVERDLIPRIHGFELLMASYAMCHLKLDMILTEMGYRPTGTPPRLSVYLTNSLEEGKPANQSLPFAQWLSNEVKQANTIKRDMPIMCVIGNPPYSGISQNMGDFIVNLIEDYKYVDGKHFGERKHWLHDDYVKFIRLSEHFIERNGEGVLGFITNHGYLDNPTFRGMRWHLLSSFSEIYVIDLHGNSNKKEVAANGKPDKNIFDIQQGVAIVIGVRRKSKSGAKSLADVYRGDLRGSREEKYATLFESRLSSLTKKIECSAPQYFFETRDLSLDMDYSGGFSVSALFGVQSTGVVTSRDDFIVDEDRQRIAQRVTDFTDLAISDSVFQARYALGENYQWKISEQRRLSPPYNPDLMQRIDYRLFDQRHIYYQDNLVFRARREVFGNFLRGGNIGLTTTRMTADDFGAFISACMISNKFASRYDQSYSFPLYLYPAEQDLDQSRRVNFDPKLFARLQALATHPTHGTPDEVQVFDYIYGVLHCPAYRATYAEFLKIDFPRIPWPASPEEFWDLSAKGTILRKLHLMDPATIGPTPYPFQGDGDAKVEAPRFADGKVWINRTQYFADVPDVSWTFFIGGYQPAQKWLKDRKGRELSFDDVKHYQKIIRILAETDRIMKTITMTLGADG